MAEPEDILLADTSELLVTWPDGHASVYGPVYLRKRCPCALCRERQSKLTEKPRGLVMAVGPEREEVRALSYAPVGRYAISVKWQDGHDTGIYSYTYLRSICPCPACESARADR